MASDSLSKIVKFPKQCSWLRQCIHCLSFFGIKIYPMEFYKSVDKVDFPRVPYFPDWIQSKKSDTAIGMLHIVFVLCTSIITQKFSDFINLMSHQFNNSSNLQLCGNFFLDFSIKEREGNYWNQFYKVVIFP